MKQILVLSLLLFCSTTAFSQTQDEQLIDSIISLRDLSKQTDNYDVQDRQEFAELAFSLAQDLNIDSTLLASSKNLAIFYFYSDQLEKYRDQNRFNLELSTEMNDSLSIGVALLNLGYYNYLESISDSAYFYYYRARDHYKLLNDKQNEGEALAMMADIQESERDYVGSESNAVKAIKLIEQLPKTERNLDTIWILYNLLGINSWRMELYEQAIEYHSQALEYSKQINSISGHINRMFSLNNLAVVYRHLEDFEMALKYHNDLINDPKIDLLEKDSYAYYLTNQQFSMFLSGQYDLNTLKQTHWNSKKLCDEQGFDYCSLVTRLNLAKIYNTLKVTDSSIIYAHQANEMARETSRNDEVLESLILLSTLESGDEAKNHLNEYVTFSDSLIHNERIFREKYARIEYETDQIIAENQQISRERQIFLLAAIGLLVTLILVYIIISQRTRNRELRFNQMQQEANEEIYNLMLAQQDKMEEGRTKEKKRISEELHDGILGRLFGTRLSLDSLNFQNTEEAVKTRSQYIDELKSIEQEIRKISHDLNADFIGGSSFSDILKTLVENQTNAFQLTYDYEEDQMIDWDELNNRTKIHIYRMLQETMQNVYKHAQANHIKISFELKNDVILLTVEDNGKGFNTNRARRGIGLKNFESRASDIGGKVEIISKEGFGTRVKIFAPFTS